MLSIEYIQNTQRLFSKIAEIAESKEPILLESERRGVSKVPHRHSRDLFYSLKGGKERFAYTMCLPIVAVRRPRKSTRYALSNRGN